MDKLKTIAALLILAGLCGCADRQRPEGPRAEHGSAAPAVWECAYTATPPKIDGVMDDVWRAAKPLTVTIREAIGGHSPKQVVLRALHTDDTLFVLARWTDATRSDMRDPYVWNAAKKLYERPSKPDDQFAITFPISGDFSFNMLTLKHRYVADVWHWKAGRGNPVGWVDDKRHIIGQEPTPKAREYSMGGRGKVYIARLMDEGTASYALKPPPDTFQGDTVDSFEPRQPTGSLADVRGKGVHDGKTWTLEMSRKFNTGHADDAVIDPARDNTCAIAILDDELNWNHSVSQPITLRFLRGRSGSRSSLLLDFERQIAGRAPAGFTVAVTGRGQAGEWVVKEQPDAPSGKKVLAQTSTDRTSRRFPLCVCDQLTAKDVEVSVRFKPIAGTVDQAAGIVWRYQDPSNYYVVRANALENNVVLYKVEKGKRTDLKPTGAAASAYGRRTDVPSGRWSTLRLVATGDQFEVHLNGEELFQVEDATFTQAGRVGLWTKADSVTYFDDLRIESHDPR